MSQSHSCGLLARCFWLSSSKVFRIRCVHVTQESGLLDSSAVTLSVTTVQVMIASRYVKKFLSSILHTPDRDNSVRIGNFKSLKRSHDSVMY